MEKFLSIITFVVFVIGVSASGLYAQMPDEIERQRRAQTGMKFLSISTDARTAAMGGASTAREGSSISMFYNPAGMASLTDAVHASFGHVQWIGNYSYNAGSVAYSPSEGLWGVFGISVMAAEYGDFIETIRTDETASGFRELGRFSPSVSAVGLGYARALSDRFSVGAHVKYASQSLGHSAMSVGNGNVTRESNDVSTLAVDFGVLYRTGYQSLNFAMNVRNFSQELTYAQESFELPLTFNVGVSMDVLDFSQVDSGMHSLLVAVDARRPRDFSEQLKVGTEYVFMDMLALRAGYVFPTDEQGINLGGGLTVTVGNIGLGADYAYTQFGLFGNVNRVSLQLSL